MLQKINKNNQLSKKLNKLEFSAKYSPKSCMVKFRDVKTIKKAITEKVGSLSQIKKGYGVEFQTTYVEGWIIDLQEKVGVKNKMNKDMIEECAMFILEEYYYLNIADINLIFTRAKKGHYGKLYESISMPKILEWFEDYSNDRAEIAFQTNLSEHKAVKNSKSTGASLEYAKELKKANQTKDFTKIDNLLKQRLNPSEQEIKENTTNKKAKIEGLKKQISDIEIMKEEHENPLMKNQYDKVIFTLEKQLEVLTTKKQKK